MYIDDMHISYMYVQIYIQSFYNIYYKYNIIQYIVSVCIDMISIMTVSTWREKALSLSFTEGSQNRNLSKAGT